MRNPAPLPSHAVLRSFEAAARHESFTLAAEELHLTQSAISRQVKELEILTGITLFRRSGRRVVLTDAGRNLARELAVDLANIRQTIYRATAAGDHGFSLRIATLPTFASRWLIPRLPQFYQRHPEITLSLSTRLQPFDIAKERFDVAIHFGGQDWPDTRMTRLFDEEMIPVCAPDFFTTYAVQNVADLAQLPLLHLDTRPTAWADWFQKFNATGKQAYSGKQFDQFSMLIAAATASLGVALLPRYLIENELADGRLAQIGSDFLQTSNSYFVVTSAGNTGPHVDAFTKWICTTARANAKC